jgi:hypothetical protein
MIEAARDSDAVQALALLDTWRHGQRLPGPPQLSIGRYRLLYAMAR